LKRFAEAVGTGPLKRIVLVLDRAGWHASSVLVTCVPCQVRMNHKNRLRHPAGAEEASVTVVPGLRGSECRASLLYQV
jgi:hypothetical protein